VTARAAIVAVLALVICAGGAGAKDFGPGDLRVCNADRCVGITNSDVLPLLGSFYYGGPPPKAASGPALGTAYYELRFRNGYVTGIVARSRLDRFLSYGVYLERFKRGTWYRVPARMSAELRRLTASLAPLHVTRTAFARSR
jgi:hypothetical protein